MDSKRSRMLSDKDWDDIIRPAEADALEKAGAYMRQRMKWMLSKRKHPNRSKPGQPPARRHGLLWAKVRYGYDPEANEVLVGPMFMSKPHRGVWTIDQPTIPATLEFGGRERVLAKEYDLPWGWLPPNRVVYIRPRPFARPTLKKTRAQVRQMFHDMIGRSPAAMRVARNKKGKGVKVA